MGAVTSKNKLYILLNTYWLLGQPVCKTFSTLLSLPLPPFHSLSLQQTYGPARRYPTVGLETRLQIHKTLCNFVNRTFTFAGCWSTHCHNYELKDHSLSAVRNYSLNEIILSFSCTVWILGRVDRETRNWNKITDEWYGIRIPKDSIMYIPAPWIEKCFTETTNWFNLITRQRNLLIDKKS